MALSQENKYRVIFALCQVGTIIDPTSVNFNSVFRDRLNIDNPFIEKKVISLLCQIESIREKLQASPSKSNIKKIDDIEFDTDKSLSLINKELKRLLSELSQILDVQNACKTGGTGNVCVCL